MVDASALPVAGSQEVRITLENKETVSIVLERITLHFGETPTSGAPFAVEEKVEVGPRQHAVLVEATSKPEAVRSVELNYVRYADGSSWHPQ